MKEIYLKSENFLEIKNIFNKNEIVIFPTDTIWGMSALANNEGVKKIQNLKRREVSKPFVLLVKNLDFIFKNTILTSFEKKLLEFFYGDLSYSQEFGELKKEDLVSFVLKRKKGFLSDFFPDFEKLAFRVVKNMNIAKFLKFIDFPIISTSVNKSGFSPITNKQDIKKNYPENILINLSNFQENSFPSKIIEIIDEKIIFLR